jgi:hypothetical protein
MHEVSEGLGMGKEIGCRWIVQDRGLHLSRGCTGKSLPS